MPTDVAAEAPMAMNGVPREILREAYERRPIFLLKIPMLFGLWASMAAALYASYGKIYFHAVGVLSIIVVAYCVRGLGAAAHDAVHGNLARSKFVSYIIAFFCWAPTGMSVSVYRNYHLHHHRITNTYPDVDNVVITDYTTSPFWAKALLLAIYTFAYPLYFMTKLGRYVKRLSGVEKLMMVVELAIWWGFVVACFFVMPTPIFMYFYIAPFVFGAHLASLTSMIEHFDMPLTEDNAYSSRTYGVKSHFANFFWNNVTYHNEHHKYPGIPFYNLRRFHEKARPYYDETIQGRIYPSVWGLAFKLYGQILKLDMNELKAKYADLDRQAEDQQMMAQPGIPTEPVLSA